MAEEVKLESNTCMEMLAVLKNSRAETPKIIQILHNIEGHISEINEDFQSLVQVIMKLDWLDKGPEFIEVYKAFILNLLSANVYYLKPFLSKMIKSFLEETIISEDGCDKQKQISKNQEDFLHIHALLQSLAKIVPMTTIVFFPLLEDKFPYINKSVSIFEKYTRNILTISTYIPTMRIDILDLIVKQMLKLDVRLSRQTIVNTVNEDDGEDESIFEMDVSDAKNKSKPCTPTAKLASSYPPAGSLDAMMNLMFNYISQTCRPKGILDWEATKKLYRELLSTFHKFILPSHSSNHVQFIMFYICSFKEELAIGFIDYLWKKVTDPNTQAIYRQMGACYLGSFLARAGYIHNKTAKEVLELMQKWLHIYLDQTSDQNAFADMAHHSAFYSVCQASFYIFCFKHNQFLEKRKDHKWAQSLNFQRLVTCKLNPLKICQPIIVQTFSSAARTHQLAFCDTVIERNNRFSLPIASGQSVHVPGESQLDSYFPFDPYLLPGSSSFIDPLYKEFQGNVIEDAEEDCEDDDDFLPEEEGGSASHNAISVLSGKGPIDFLHYGTSPGFQHAK